MFILHHVQVWRYDEGEVTHVGVGHSGEITAVKISPDGRTIVSVSADGAILRWRFPDELLMSSTDGVNEGDDVIATDQE